MNRKMKYKVIALLVVLCTVVSGLQYAAPAVVAEDGVYWEFTKVTCTDDLKKAGIGTTPSSDTVILITYEDELNDTTNYVTPTLNSDRVLGKSIEENDDIKSFDVSAETNYLYTVSDLWLPFVDNSNGEYTLGLKSPKKNEYLVAEGSQAYTSYFKTSASQHTNFSFRFYRDNQSIKSYTATDGCQIYCESYSYRIPLQFIVQNSYKVGVTQRGDRDVSFRVWIGQKKTGVNPLEKGSSASDYDANGCWKFTKVTSIDDLKRLGFNDKEKNETGHNTHSAYSSSRDTSNWRVMIVSANLCSSSSGQYKAGVDVNNLTYEDYVNNGKLCYLKDEPLERDWGVASLSAGSKYRRFLTGDDVIYTESADDLPVLLLNTTEPNSQGIRSWTWNGLNLSIWSPSKGVYARVIDNKSGKIQQDDETPGGFYFCFAEDNAENIKYFSGQTDCCTIINDLRGEYCYCQAGRFNCNGHRFDQQNIYLDETDKMQTFWVWVGHYEAGNGSSYKSHKSWKFTKVTSWSDLEELGFVDKSVSQSDYNTHSAHSGCSDTTNWRVMIVSANLKSGDKHNLSFKEYADAGQLCFVEDEPLERDWNVKNLNEVEEYKQFITGDDVIYTDTADDLPVLLLSTTEQNFGYVKNWKGMNMGIWSPTHKVWARILEGKKNRGKIIQDANTLGGFYFCFAKDNSSRSNLYYGQTDCCTIISDVYAEYLYCHNGRLNCNDHSMDQLLAADIDKMQTFWIWIGQRTDTNTYYTLEENEVYEPAGVTKIPDHVTLNVPAGSTLHITDTLYLGGTIKNYGTIVVDKQAKLIMNCNGQDGIINCIGGDIVLMEGSELLMEKKCVNSSGGYITMKNSTLSCNGKVTTKLPSGATQGLFFNLQGGCTVEFTDTATHDFVSYTQGDYLTTTGLNSAVFPNPSGAGS